MFGSAFRASARAARASAARPARTSCRLSARTSRLRTAGFGAASRSRSDRGRVCGRRGRRRLRGRFRGAALPLGRQLLLRLRDIGARHQVRGNLGRNLRGQRPVARLDAGHEHVGIELRALRQLRRRNGVQVGARLGKLAAHHARPGPESQGVRVVRLSREGRSRPAFRFLPVSPFRRFPRESHGPDGRGRVAASGGFESLLSLGGSEAGDLLLFGLHETRERRDSEQRGFLHALQKQGPKLGLPLGLEVPGGIRGKAALHFEETGQRGIRVLGLAVRRLREGQPGEARRQPVRAAEEAEGRDPELIDRLAVPLLVEEVLPRLEPRLVEVRRRGRGAEAGDHHAETEESE